LPCSYERYIKQTKSAKSRQTLLRKERRLRKKHAVDVEFYSDAEITTDIVARVSSIQEQSWMKRRGAAILGRVFYQELLLAMAQGGFACAWLMTIDKADAAFVFALVAHRRLYYAWTAVDLQYASSLSIGQFLTSWTIRQACRDGMETYDFMHGDAQYKRFWSTDCHSVYRVVSGRGLWGRCLTAVHSMPWQLAKVQSLRLLLHRLRRTLAKPIESLRTVRVQPAGRPQKEPPLPGGESGDSFTL
jgi:CelD/BcsL family acetyltransferase involved in cellulose biosynthesis